MNDIGWIEPRISIGARALAGWTQTDLSTRSGVAIAAVRRWELDTVRTRDGTRAALVEALVTGGIEFLPPEDGFGPGFRFSAPIPSDVTVWSRLIVAGRTVSGWTQLDLSERSSVAIAALKRFEIGAVRTRENTRLALVKALEAGGVTFLPEGKGHGPGLRWRQPFA